MSADANCVSGCVAEPRVTCTLLPNVCPAAFSWAAFSVAVVVGAKVLLASSHFRLAEPTCTAAPLASGTVTLSDQVSAPVLV